MKGQKPQVFISYGKEDLNLARRIASFLENKKCRIWLDTKRLIPGEHWRGTIPKAIRQSDYFVAILSTRSVSRRGYIHAELKEAIAVWSETPYPKVYLIPVRVDDCDLSDVGLGDLHWVDLFDRYDGQISTKSWDISMSLILESVSHRRGYSFDSLSTELMEHIYVYRNERSAFEKSIQKSPRSTLGVKVAARARCQFADNTISRIFEHVCLEGGVSPAQFALVARGGFGRGYLATDSDIDLTLLHVRSEGPDAEKVFNVFSVLLADVWCNVSVAPVINTVNQCVSHWKDFNSLVAFSSTRFICGDLSICTELLGRWQTAVRELQPSTLTSGLREQTFIGPVKSSLPRLINFKHFPGGLMEITHIGFLEELLKAREIDASGVSPDRLVVDRAFDFLLRAREEAYSTTTSSAVTIAGMPALAAKVFPDADDPKRVFLSELQRYRAHVRKRFNGLLSFVVTSHYPQENSISEL